MVFSFGVGIILFGVIGIILMFFFGFGIFILFIGILLFWFRILNYLLVNKIVVVYVDL